MGNFNFWNHLKQMAFLLKVILWCNPCDLHTSVVTKLLAKFDT